jgi:hypothetical protein
MRVMPTVWATLAYLAGAAVLGFAASAQACDKSAARKLQDTLRVLATWSVDEAGIAFRWGRGWEDATRGEQLILMRGAADADACLSGRVRPIRFYAPDGKLIMVSPPAATGVAAAR